MDEKNDNLFEKKRSQSAQIGEYIGNNLWSFFLIFICIVLIRLVVPYSGGLMGDIRRYKMTVEIQTPEGLKIGSAVREIRLNSSVISIKLPESHTGGDLEGEAVVVDLGKRGQVFALIDSSNLIEGISWQAASDLHGFNQKSTPIGTKWTMSFRDYPRLVAFKDINNPATMKTLLEVRDFEEMFGPGVQLEEITVERTNEPVTAAIEKYLPWLPCLDRIYVPGSASYSLAYYENMASGMFKIVPPKFRLTIWPDYTPKQIEEPECVAYWQKWDDYDRKKYLDSISHWQTLADQGNPEAQFELGNVYAKGEGRTVPAQTSEAEKWYLKAAEQGHLDAILKLGELYWNWRRFEESYYWYGIAQKNFACIKTDNAKCDYQSRMDWVYSQLSANQQNEVQKRIAAWSPVKTDAMKP